MCNYELQRNPATHPAQLGVGAAPEEWGTHHPDDFPQELVMASQTPFDLDHQILREAYCARQQRME